MKLNNDQRNKQGFNLFIYLFLPYMLRAFCSPPSEAGVQLRQWFKSPSIHRFVASSDLGFDAKCLHWLKIHMFGQILVVNC
jgi:hypothetical protein